MDTLKMETRPKLSPTVDRKTAESIIKRNADALLANAFPNEVIEQFKAKCLAQLEIDSKADIEQAVFCQWEEFMREHWPLQTDKAEVVA